MNAPTAGYPGTPLDRKLGFKEGYRALFVGPPEGFVDSLGLSPAVEILAEGDEGRVDLAVLFARSIEELEAGFAPIAKRLTLAGMMWAAWPKKSSGVKTDLTENVIRDYGLSTGLVDVKVCAIDETWSGLKFVIRLKDRK